MSLFDERFMSSLELPNPADFPGEIAFSFERGGNQCCAWLATGGETGAVWVCLGASYRGPLSGLPSAANVRIGAQATIDEPAPTLTRPPTGGTKMQPVDLVVRFKPDGVTKAWMPRGSQTMYQLGGTPAAPAIPLYTSVATAAIVGEIGQLPANFLATIYGELFFRILCARASPAAGPVSFVLSLSAASGTPGNAAAICPNVVANVNAVGWLEGSLWVADATHQAGTYNIAPGGNTNTGAAGVPLTQDLTVAQTLQLSFSGATVGDKFGGASVTIGIR